MQSQPASLPLLNQQEIARRSNPLTLDHQCIYPLQHRTDKPLLTGCFQVIALRHGLILHTANVHNLHEVITQATLMPSIKLAIVIEGQADISFDQQHFVLGRSSDQHCNTASLVSLTRPTRFERRGLSQGYEKTVSISFSHAWLLDSLPSIPKQLLPFLEQHLSSHLWQPSKKALTIAQQILTTPPTLLGMHHLFLESRCIELISEALFSLIKPTPSYARETPPINQQLMQAKLLLDNPQFAHLSPADIAQHIGMSISSLQRYFRSNFHVSVAQYHRQQRLKRALLSLQKDQINISQAADIAGYSNAANFATAVKKEFGVTPKQFQNKF